MRVLMLTLLITCSPAFAGGEGTIKLYNEKRDLGFLTPDGLPFDYFFHTDGIDTTAGDIHHGCRVTYDVESEVRAGGDERTAVNIRRISCPTEEEK